MWPTLHISAWHPSIIASPLQLLLQGCQAGHWVRGRHLAQAGSFRFSLQRVLEQVVRKGGSCGGTKQPLHCGHSPRHHCRRPNPHTEKVLVRRKAVGQSRQIACREKLKQGLLLLCRRQKLTNSLVLCASTWFPFLETWGSSCWIFSKTTFNLYYIK